MERFPMAVVSLFSRRSHCCICSHRLSLEMGRFLDTAFPGKRGD